MAVVAGACAVALASALASGVPGPGVDCSCGPGLAEQLGRLQSDTRNGAAPRIALEGGLADIDAVVLAGALRECGPRAGLEGLSVTRCPALGADSLAALAAAALAPGLRLQLLDLSGNVRLGDAGAAALGGGLRGSGGPALRELRLGDCSLTPAGLAALAWGGPAPAPAAGASEREREKAEGSSPGPVGGPPPLSGIGIAAASEPGQASDREAGEDTAMPPPPPPAPGGGGGHALAPQLRVLHLSGNALGGAGAVLARFARLPRLEELRLKRCGLLADDVRRLAAALPRSGLTCLDLSRNGLGTPPVLALAGALPRSRLEDLDLEGNAVEGNEALRALGEACAERPVLRLRLQGNRILAHELDAFAHSIGVAHAGPVRFGSAGVCPPDCEYRTGVRLRK